MFCLVRVHRLCLRNEFSSVFAIVISPTKFTALQTIVYALLLIPVGMLPYYLGITGVTSLIIVILTNIFLVIQCIRLYRQMDVKAARRVMFSSYIHLPIVLLTLLVDKIG